MTHHGNNNGRRRSGQGANEVRDVIEIASGRVNGVRALVELHVRRARDTRVHRQSIQTTNLHDIRRLIRMSPSSERARRVGGGKSTTPLKRRLVTLGAPGTQLILT